MSASLSRLRSFYGELKTPLLLHAMIKSEFSGSIAIVASSSPNAETLLTWVAGIEPATPVLWLGGDTLPEKLGLTQVTHTQAAQVDGIIEDRALLAVISDEVREAGKERIILDADGVFRIYPYSAQATQEPAAQDNADWSV